MTPAEARAAHRRQVDQHGETIVIRRYAGTGNSRVVSQSVSVRARVASYSPQQLVGSIQQGDTKLIVLAEDFEGSAFSPAPKSGETGLKAVVGGREKSIEAIDDRTRRIQGVLIAYEMQVRG